MARAAVVDEQKAHKEQGHEQQAQEAQEAQEQDKRRAAGRHE